ncbi:UNVERIFIED_CONTAM: Ribonuclease 3-like protein 3 [Sesamum radiatum]|uniref:Ribonuclease 3-like protein 3 n=1 Tax=Sesamum radiatum TaxID=300843 RepID=A0AAW2K6G0_SESRA
MQCRTRTRVGPRNPAAAPPSAADLGVVQRPPPPRPQSQLVDCLFRLLRHRRKAADVAVRPYADLPPLFAAWFKPRSRACGDGVAPSQLPLDQPCSRRAAAIASAQIRRSDALPKWQKTNDGILRVTKNFKKFTELTKIDCVSYERLEYVGDSVLNLLITKEQFSMYSELPPGLLTPLRAANVDTEKLARVAIQHNFHRYIRLGNPVLIKQIQAFIDALPKHPLHSHGLINAPKVLADVVESTVGAVFVDSNYSIDTTWEVASDLLKPIITPEMLQKNPVKKLFEICQKHKLKVKLVDLWSQEGTYKVFINNKLRGKGMCREKKEIALNRAANDAYKEVVRRISGNNFNEGC